MTKIKLGHNAKLYKTAQRYIYRVSDIRIRRYRLVNGDNLKGWRATDRAGNTVWFSDEGYRGEMTESQEEALKMFRIKAMRRLESLKNRTLATQARLDAIEDGPLAVAQVRLIEDG